MLKKSDQTREIILQAATNRFLKEGFKKTNVKQIAEDCDMSPANLYRFYDGKGEIGAAVVNRNLSHTQKLVDEILSMEGDAKKKLKSFVLKTLEYNHSIFNHQAKLFELIQFISEKYPDLPRRNMTLKKECLGKILSEAHQKPTKDLTRLAHLYFQALRQYLMPHAMMQVGMDLQGAKQDAEDLIEILFAGGWRGHLN